jgi:hypothetical protein
VIGAYVATDANPPVTVVCQVMVGRGMEGGIRADDRIAGDGVAATFGSGATVGVTLRGGATVGVDLEVVLHSGPPRRWHHTGGGIMCHHWKRYLGRYDIRNDV